MKGIAFAGKKGGVGKTALAHALALGAAWEQIPAYLMHTDDREPLKVSGRPYGYYDAREPGTLETLINTALNNDGLCIIDGGGNRPEFDKWIAKSMDLVIVPFIPDQEAVETNLTHMAELERAGANISAIINAYPANRFEQKHIAKYLAPIPKNKIIGYVSEHKAIRTLRVNDDPSFKTPVTKINKLARHVYTLVKTELNKIT